MRSTKADIRTAMGHVRFTPNSDTETDIVDRQIVAVP
jgi:hypothetical protein